jgi:putative adenylate-forming enzyme
LSIAPRQVISVAEVLEDDDAQAAVQAWGIAPSQIYQCTEGFIGASCENGHVHVNEQYMLIEPEWLDEDHTHFRPLVTDFMRRSQAFVRFRLDDVLRPLPGPCACGRPSLALARIEGRADERLWLPHGTGTLHPIYPDAVRHTIARAQSDWPADVALQDYRLIQHGLRWELSTQPPVDATRLHSLKQALTALCSQAGLATPEIIAMPWTPDDATRKRRRIRCAQMPSEGHQEGQQ